MAQGKRPLPPTSGHSCNEGYPPRFNARAGRFFLEVCKVSELFNRIGTRTAPPSRLAYTSPHINQWRSDWPVFLRHPLAPSFMSFAPDQFFRFSIDQVWCSNPSFFFGFTKTRAWEIFIRLRQIGELVFCFYALFFEINNKFVKHNCPAESRRARQGFIFATHIFLRSGGERYYRVYSLLYRLLPSLWLFWLGGPFHVADPMNSRSARSATYKKARRGFFYRLDVS